MELTDNAGASSSSSNSSSTYSYDPASRATQMTQGSATNTSSNTSSTYTYDASSNLTTLPNGVAGTYDNAVELTSSVLPSTASSPQTSTTYTHNANEVATPGETFTPGTLECIAENPWPLQGMNPEQLLNNLGLDPDNLPSGITIRPGNSESAGLGSGWTLGQSGGGGITIRWSPGTPRAGDGVHPEGLYWNVTGGRYPQNRDISVAGDDWDGGPEPYVARPNSQSESNNLSQPDDECLTAVVFGYLTSCGGDELGLTDGDEGFGADYVPVLEGYGYGTKADQCQQNSAWFGTA